MKKISIIVATLVLLVALTQCKKEQVAPASDGETVAITLDIKSSKDTRVDVNTGTGAVTYQSGDVIYVASGGKYVGTLTHNGTRFAGTITDPVVGKPLHFYFLGNVTPVETLTAGTTQTCSVVISDQTARMPVIEYAPSDQNYTAGASNFSAMLLNKCALVKFNVTTSSEAATCITGFNNKVTVNFSDNTLIDSQEGNGVITLPSGSGEKWAILLPQQAMAAGATGSAYSSDGVYRGRRGAVPAINNNGYLTVGIDVTITSDAPIGAICGKFTINEDGDQVYFSQGNLQYIGSAETPYWKFADNQWDYFGTKTGQNSSDQNVDRDLFGWGTSGWHDSNDLYNVNYQPWSTSTSSVNSDYNYYGYGPSTNMLSPDLIGSSEKYDWGVYNSILNGGNQPNQWHVLTQPELVYIFNGRLTISGIHYANANVNEVNGVILLPDDWDADYYNLSNTDQYYASFSSNTILSSQWSVLEQHGAVFLPAAGYRWGTSVNDIGSYGGYWSTSYFGSKAAKPRNFSGSGILYTGCDRPCGFSVRLVRDVQ